MTPVSLAHSRNSAIGNLDQDAGAVAHQRIGAHRAAMVEIDQKLQALADDLMGLGALDVGDKADAARVMLVARVVKTLFRRQTHRQPQSPYIRRTQSPPSCMRQARKRPFLRDYRAHVTTATSCGAT